MARRSAAPDDGRPSAEAWSGVLASALAGSPRIGPNAIIQTLRALQECEPPEVERRVRAIAALPDAAPTSMVPEACFIRLVGAVRAALPAERSEAVLRLSGRRTAEYVAQRRIPPAVRQLVRVLPARLAVPVMLSAFGRNAETFAGAGRFRVVGPYPGSIFLVDCPTCRHGTGAGAAGTAGAYYEAAFQGLLRLAAPHARVHEDACALRGAPHCEFRITLDDRDAQRVRAKTEKEAPCASC
jgi:divinyl protochlorophyllide a 8-vinyl-reductase